MTRCGWAESSDEMRRYHDEEWGLPVHEDRRLFEMLTLEGAQAGLSWETVLKKREGYRAAFQGFDIETVAAFTESDIDRIVLDPSVIRHRGKIASTVTNARAAMEVQREFGSLEAYLWSFVGGVPQVNVWATLSDLPAKTAVSDAMSKALMKRGFRFVGSTICYAFMQACGMVDDHLPECFRRSG